MKSRLTIAVLFILLSCRASAQEWVEGGLYAEHYQLGYRSQQQIGGIVHVGLMERFTVNWQIGIGPANDGGFYMHAPAGLVAGYVLMRNQQNRPIINSLPLFNNLGALLFLCPEGVGYYVTEGKMRMHVSVNPLGFDFWKDRSTGFQVGRMSGSVVVRCRLLSNMKWPIYLAPQVAATFIYRETENGALNRIGFRAGVTIGLSSEER